MLKSVKDTFNKRTRLLGILILAAVLFSSPLLAAEYDFAWPVENFTMNENSASQARDKAPHIKRKGRIGIAKLLLVSQSLQVDDILSLNLFGDTPYRIKIREIKRDKKGIITIMGKIDGEDLSTFLLTVSPNNYLLSLHDINKNFVYRVTGEMGSGEGHVTEIDKAKVPPRIHLPPLIPKE